MDSAGKNPGRAFADKTADKAQGGINDAKDSINSATASASKKVESIRSGADHALGNAAEKAPGMLDSVSDAAQKAKDVASDTQDSIVSYTREQPVKSLLLAAAAGAILVTLIRALSPARKS